MKFPTYERREDPRPCYPQETDGTPQGPKAYTALEMEAALCAWEFLMDNDVRSGCIGEIPDTATPFQKFISECMDGWGYAQMRYAARMLGTYIPRVYDAYEKAYGDYDDAYDWEFVPAVIKALPLEEVFEAGAYKREYAWPRPSDVVEVMREAWAEDKLPTWRIHLARTETFANVFIKAETPEAAKAILDDRIASEPGYLDSLMWMISDGNCIDSDDVSIFDPEPA